MEEYSLNKEFLLEALYKQLFDSGKFIENCQSNTELNSLADKLLKTGESIENIAKSAIDNEELSEEFTSKFIPRLFNLCTDISTRIIIKSLELGYDDNMDGLTGV